MPVNSCPKKVGIALPKAPEYADKQKKVTTGTINFNNMRTASIATLIPRSLRSRPKNVYEDCH